ncbi:MAG: TIGR00730 family Rossman fold protein [Rickettsiales bacterium]|nr:TIGR00730 family Rossman fold protein [Rickettsiales bacterium]
MKEKIARSMAVYCGHQLGNNPQYAADAARLGGLLAENKIKLVFGGGKVGLMGEVAKAVLAGGGEVVSVTTPNVLALQEPVIEGAETEIKETLLERKARMIELADASCILPGGMGTLNELTDILTMHQIRESHQPLYFLNTDGYWDAFGKMLKLMIKDGFVKDQAEYNMQIFTAPEEIIASYNSRFFA